MGERRGVYRVLVGEPEGKRPLGKPRRRWEDSIKIGLQEVRCEGMDWIDLAQDRDSWRQWRTQEFFFGGGGSINSVEDRDNGDLETVAP